MRESIALRGWRRSVRLVEKMTRWRQKHTRNNASLYRYDAFLSYAREDELAVKQVENVLARTWIPGIPRRRVFRDKTQLRAGELSSELISALHSSRFLIVCCSAHARNSRWVASTSAPPLRARRYSVAVNQQ